MGVNALRLKAAYHRAGRVLHRRRLRRLAVALSLYVLSAWLLGSFTVLFVDYDLAMRCFQNPLLAAVTVPFQGALPWWLGLNVLFGFLGYWYYLQLRARFPDTFNPRNEVDFMRDPSCGTSRWLDRQNAEKVLSFGHGPGFLFGTMEGDPARLHDSDLNRNVIVFGSPGSRKTRSLVIPNILQAVVSGESCVITDPKGEILRYTLGYLQSRDYSVNVFNLVEMHRSDRWNPLAEIQTGLDAQLFSEVVIANTAVPGIRKMGGDPFWTRAEQNLLKALALYVVNEMPPEQRNLESLYGILSCGSLDRLDITFGSLAPDHPAKAPYNVFSQADKPVKGGVIIGLGTRLQVVQNPEVKRLTSTSDMDLKRPGLEKCAYFGIVSDTDTTFDFLASLFFTFLFIKLTRLADSKGGPCPVRVNFILDEFCNIGSIPDFKKRIATVRSRGLNCVLITQSVAQLKNRYPDDEWQEVISCCDSRLLFGANEPMTARYFSDLLGVGTVNRVSRRHKATALDPVTLGHAPSPRNLLNLDEILRLDRGKAILCLAGFPPALIDKLDFTRHPEGDSLPDAAALGSVVYSPAHLDETPPEVVVEYPGCPVPHVEKSNRKTKKKKEHSEDDAELAEDPFDPFRDPFAPELDDEKDLGMHQDQGK